jgi:hypothetical protein
MKNILALLVSVLLLASCAAPKYSYHFDHYDYNSGRKHKEAEVKPSVDTETSLLAENTSSPISLQKENIVASNSPANLTPEKATVVENGNAVGKKYTEMTRNEKREFRKTLKTEIKKYIKAKKEGDVKSVNETKAMDYNLKMAIIFGAVALTLSFFGGVNTVFWVVSVVCLVIGVVFFIKWIAEQ